MSILEEGKKIAICSDHAGYELKGIIEGYLLSQGLNAMISEHTAPTAATMPISPIHAPRPLKADVITPESEYAAAATV